MSVAVRMSTVALAMTVVTVGRSLDADPSPYHPRDVGTPAGLIPHCPGVMKNATISPRKLQYLMLANHRMTSNGQIARRILPIETAAKTVLKDKLIDLKTKKTVLYTVGFWDSSVFLHSQAIGNAYAKRGYNVFVSETFSFLTQIYPKSARLSRFIGKKYGEFLVKLFEGGLPPENLELLGMSLGAHISAYAAKHFYLATGKKPHRITGLDPAGPCFRALPPELRLNSTDADFVDILHTNIDGFGMAERTGQVDFYANGGEYQPSDVPYIPCLVVCSHFKAAFYWWMALEHPKKFVGVKCDSIQHARFSECFNNSETNYFGLETKFGRSGIYYLPTNNVFPYYRGKEGLKAENEIYTSMVKMINNDNDFEV